MKRFVLLVGFFLLSITIVSAQVTPCPINYSRALDQTQALCDGTGRNQACYGNNTVNLTPFSETVEYDFDAPGDMTDVEIIRSLSLSALDEETGNWGISMLRLLANLDPSHTDDVTMLLFGDVDIESAVEPSEVLPITTTTYANVRRYPSTSSPVVNSVTENTTLMATGRLSDNTWVQITDTDSDLSGWIFADLLGDFDMDILSVVEATQPYFAPMQAFYFRSGSQIDCASVPSNGIMIQTPIGVARVSVWINEVTIDFLSNTGTTALIQMPSDEIMSVELLEGDAYVQSDQGGYIAVEGSSITVDLPNNDNHSPKVNPPEPTDQQSEVPPPLKLFNRLVDRVAPASTAYIASSNNLSTVQYNEVVEYGYVVTKNETSQSNNNADGASSQSNGSQEQTNESTDNTQTNNTQSNNTQTDNTQADNTQADNNSGNQDCPGNSCNAPGQNKDKDKKDKKDKKNK